MVLNIMIGAQNIEFYFHSMKNLTQNKLLTINKMQLNVVEFEFGLGI